jgi:hypothetical protein
VRRRFPVAPLLAAIGLVILLMIAATLLGPLNPAETQVLGEWTFADLADPAVTRHIAFHSDRTFDVWTDSASGDGTWEITDGSLILSLNTDDSPSSKMLPLFHDNSTFTEVFSLIDLERDRALFRKSQNATLELHRDSGK